MWIKPVPGRLVRDPVTGESVPAKGREVPDHHPYWRRRLNDGDVALGTKPAKGAKPAAPTPPPAKPAAADPIPDPTKEA
ncbi:DUF2635 domain-containing protein [Amorphus sp. 3PC139-8]|uniref:DUF2635 domain-containing protein n=1 Tax=Amorphus sp. 3PC139-8 TaxID=2735676 RepID=UPI00345D0CEC